MTYGVELPLADGTVLKSYRSLSGSFTHRFMKAGTYQYTSGAVDPSESIFMTGKVIVEELHSTSEEITVTVSGKHV